MTLSRFDCYFTTCANMTYFEYPAPRAVLSDCSQYVNPMKLVQMRRPIVAVSRQCTSGYKQVRNFFRHIWLPSRLSAISCLLCPRQPSAKNGFLPRLRDSASWRESRQEAESRRQSRQEAMNHVLQSQQETRDRGQSGRKQNMTHSLDRKRKLAD